MNIINNESYKFSNRQNVLFTYFATIDSNDFRILSDSKIDSLKINKIDKHIFLVNYAKY